MPASTKSIVCVCISVARPCLCSDPREAHDDEFGMNFEPIASKSEPRASTVGPERIAIVPEVGEPAGGGGAEACYVARMTRRARSSLA